MGVPSMMGTWVMMTFMVKVTIHGPMIKSMVTVFSSGLMGVSTRVSGRKGKCMEPARTLPLRAVRSELGSGKPGEEHVGNRQFCESIQPLCADGDFISDSQYWAQCVISSLAALKCDVHVHLQHQLLNKCCIV